MLAIAESKEAAAGDLPDGLHHRRGVEIVAALHGMEPDKLGRVIVFESGFSEVTGFIQSKDGRGYYMTTFNQCSCPDWRFRHAGKGGLCKHQSELIKLVKREFDNAYGTYQKAARDYVPEPLPSLESPSLPAGVVGLSSDDLEARRARIDERNRQRREEKAATVKPSTSSRGFNMPEEVAT